MSGMSKKEIKQEVEAKLMLVFNDLRDQIGSKKFNKNVKKAGKKLLSGLRHIPKKNADPKDTVEIMVS